MIYLRNIILTGGHLFIYGVHDHAHLWKQDKHIVIYKNYHFMLSYTTLNKMST